MGLFGRKSASARRPADMGELAEELAHLLVASLSEGNIPRVKDALVSDRYSAGANYAVLTAFVIVATRVKSVAEKLRTSQGQAETRALPDQVHLFPAVRTVLSAIDWKTMDGLELETREEVAYVLFMLASVIAFNEAGRASLDALKAEGIWKMMSGQS